MVSMISHGLKLCPVDKLLPLQWLKFYLEKIISAWETTVIEEHTLQIRCCNKSVLFVPFCNIFPVLSSPTFNPPV